MQLEPVVVEGRSLPVELIKKDSRTMRGKVAEGSIIIEVPSAWREEYAMKCALNIRNRMERALRKNPYAFDLGKLPGFEDMQRISAMDEEFTIRIERAEARNARARLRGSSIEIKVPESEPEEKAEERISRLVIRALSSKLYEKFEKEVNEINGRFFNARFKSIRLRISVARWGSFSSKGNLNFSSLLLFMPKEIRESVIVHELAHTRVRDHSKKFWSIVYSIMPDYKERRRWMNRYQSFPLTKRPAEYKPLSSAS